MTAWKSQCLAMAAPSLSLLQWNAFDHAPVRQHLERKLVQSPRQGKARQILFIEHKLHNCS